MVKHLPLGFIAAWALMCCHEAVTAPVSPAVVSTVAATPTPTAPSAAGAVTVASPIAPPILAPPVMAKFVDVTSSGAKIAVASRCDVLFVAAAKGSFSVSGQALGQGDVVRVSAVDALELKGSGLAVVVSALHDCTAAGPAPAATAVRVARANDAKDLSWAGGAMHARLDMESEASPDVYVGRIEGTAPVAEHDHASSWEVLCAIEASGTFTLDGVPTHIVGPAIVAVPPGRRHSWQPDAGSKLVAVQVYSPPGPEQRFKALAAAPH
jgi:mannose-6-phosphate isomerase-like protein (cupin superfamily)